MTKSDKPNCMIDPMLGVLVVSTGRVKPLAEVIIESYEKGSGVNMDELIHEVHDPDKDIRSLIDRINDDHNRLASGDWLQIRSRKRKCKKKKKK